MTGQAVVFLSEAEAAKVLGVARRTLQRWRNTGLGPPHTRMGERRIGYRSDKLYEWSEPRTFSDRSKEFGASKKFS